MLAWRLDAYRRWLTMSEPTWARVNFGPIDYQDLYYYSAPKKKDGPEVARRDRSRDPQDLREARHSAARARGAARHRSGRRRATRARAALARRGRCGVRFGLGRDHLPGGARQGRRAVHADLRGAAEASRPGEEVSRHRGAESPTISSPRSTRRCSPTARSSTCRRACAARWSFRPISASTSAIPASSSAP